MAFVTLHPLVSSMSGRMGNIVFFSRYGRQLARSYVVPANSNSLKQREKRSLFAEAVKSWQWLSPEMKSEWKRKGATLGRTGYHCYLSFFMKKDLHMGGGVMGKGSLPLQNGDRPAFPSLPLRFIYASASFQPHPSSWILLDRRFHYPKSGKPTCLW